ncbi:MAG: DUF1636 domain-containing protein [Nisaea sp.]|uniref:DUF1636 domain-containing protein n=1 Tax=Nisaea sp. TaxID=2024842 RepID=UPI001B16A482|nr:DUF1636 domain-containing protein [Nisaea sp.]MBO6562595.1 DUF1636 domain-containing protein [Nisaea sp.]
MSDPIATEGGRNRPPHPVTIDVCISCRAADGTGRNGQLLLERLEEACAGESGISLRPVECMAVCDRPVTFALRGPGLWSYVIGDADPDTQVEEIIAAARAVAASPNGVPQLKERPPVFRRGVICRLLPAPEPA